MAGTVVKKIAFTGFPKAPVADPRDVSAVLAMQLIWSIRIDSPDVFFVGIVGGTSGLPSAVCDQWRKSDILGPKNHKWFLHGDPSDEVTSWVCATKTCRSKAVLQKATKSPGFQSHEPICILVAPLSAG